MARERQSECGPEGPYGALKLVRLRPDDSLRARLPAERTRSAAAVFILNTFHSFQHSFGLPMLVFVGATLFMLLRLWQMQSSGTEPYHRWWAALLISLVSVVIVVVAG